jgi:hypothetical protein
MDTTSLLRWPRARFAMRVLRMLAVAGLPFACTGCVPVLVHHYYEPAATGGHVREDVCWHRTDVIEFKQPYAAIESRIRRRDDRQFVEMRWQVVPGRTIAFASDVVQYAPTGSAPTALKLSQRSYEDPLSTEEALTPLVGSYLPPPAMGGTFKVFWLYAALPTEPTDAFRIALPPLSIEGTSIAPHGEHFPELTFRAKTTLQYLAPIQC